MQKGEKIMFFIVTITVMCYDHSGPHRVPREIESGLHYNVSTNFEIEMAFTLKHLQQS